MCSINARSWQGFPSFTPTTACDDEPIAWRGEGSVSILDVALEKNFIVYFFFPVRGIFLVLFAPGFPQL